MLSTWTAQARTGASPVPTINGHRVEAIIDIANERSKARTGASPVPTIHGHRVEAIIDIANERSKDLLLKLGFTYEGNLRQRFPFRGHFEDEYFFGLLKDEWHEPVNTY